MKKLKVLLACLVLLSLPMFARDVLNAEMNTEDGARSFLIEKRIVSEGSLDFQTLDVLDDELGQTHVRFQPTLNGLPVYGEQIIVHVWTGTGEVIGVDGKVVVSNDSNSMKAAIDPMMAFERATGMSEFDLNVDPELAYVVNENNEAVYSYMMEVSYEDASGPQRDRMFFDAKTGDLVARHPQHMYAKNRITYSANNGTSLPGTTKRTEGSANIGDACIDNAHNYAGLTYDYYSSVHGRDSLNNAGMTIKSTAHYSTNYNNAYWSGSQMVYGDGDGSTFTCLSGDLDVVAHELSHGVCTYTANLTYSNESGALNEANSDIMAAAVESANGASSSNIWKIGEDIYTPGTSGDALRYMSNPTQDGSSKDYYPERYTGTSDNGGVHWNSGIANLYFYLLSNGGTHPRGKTTVSVSGIGITTAAKIWYRALSVYMTSSTNFSGARTACLNAATDLYGSSSTQYTQVCNAWAAVGVGTCGGGTSCTPSSSTTSNISASKSTWKYYSYALPTCATSFSVSISGGTGDADLYLRLTSNPTTSTYACRSYKSGNSDSCTIANPTTGTWKIGLYAYAAFSGVKMVTSHQ